MTVKSRLRCAVMAFVCLSAGIPAVAGGVSAAERQPVALRLVEQMTQAVNGGDLTALFNTLKRLDQTDVRETKQPVLVLRELLRVLNSPDGRWLDTGVKTLIARQTKRLAHVLLLKQSNVEDKVRGELHELLGSAVRMMNEKTQPVSDLSFGLDCTRAVLTALATRGSSQNQADSQMLRNLVALTFDEQSPVDQNRRQKLYERVNHGKHRKWYETVLMMEILKRKAAQDPQALEQLRRLIWTHQWSDYHVVYSGIDALTYVIVANKNLQLVLAAYCGEEKTGSGPLLALKDYSVLKKSPLRSHWQLRAKLAQSAIVLSHHENPRIAHSARRQLAELKAHEEDKRVLLVLGRPEIVTAVYGAVLRDWREGSSYEQALASHRSCLLTDGSCGQTVAQVPANVRAPAGKTPVGAKPLSAGLHNLPAFDAQAFTGRDGLLKQVQTRLQAAGRRSQNGVTRTLALHGMGGVGKTSLALAYGHRHYGGMGGVGKTTLALAYGHRHLRKTYRTVWWVNAESRAAAMVSLRDIAAIMGMKSASMDKDAHVIQYVHRKLVASPGWLLILDNVDDKTALGDLRDRFCSATGGHILITSRDSDWGRRLPVDVFSKKEAHGFLSSFRRPKGEQDRAAMVKLADKVLGRLPLALAQAGAYIRAANIGFVDYLDLFDRRRADLWKAEEPDSAYNRDLSVAVTLNLSLEKVKRESLDAARIAHVMAYLDPDNVPKYLLQGLVEDDKGRLRKALKLLARRGIIVQAGDRGKMYSMHRLQQTVIRDRLDAESEEQTLRQAVEVLGRVWRYNEFSRATWTSASQMASHIRTLWQHTKTRNTLVKQMLPLANSVGNYYRATDALDEAACLLKQAVMIGDQLTGIDDELAISYHNLGLTFHYIDDYKRAIKMYEKSIKIKLKENLDDIYLAMTYNFLGWSLLYIGEYDKAINYHEKVLKMKLTPGILSAFITSQAYNNLGLGHLHKRNLQQAILYLEKAVNILSKSDSKNHYLAFWYSNLGSAYNAVGKYDKAINALQTSLRISRDALGQKHPDTGFPYCHLGRAYAGKKDYEKAIKKLKISLSIFRNSLGDKNSNLAGVYINIGHCYLSTKKTGKAIDALTSALQVRRRSLGDQSPRVGEVYQKLGDAYANRKKYGVSINLFEKALDIYRRKLTPDHPDTQATKEALAKAREALARHRSGGSLNNQANELGERRRGQKQ